MFGCVGCLRVRLSACVYVRVGVYAFVGLIDCVCVCLCLCVFVSDCVCMCVWLIVCVCLFVCAFGTLFVLL